MSFRQIICSSTLLCCLACCLACAPVAASAADNASKPNIVFILSDDMGYAQPGFTGGNPELTPNIDKLAGEGMQLTQFYTHSVCSPTRAAFMTGRYAFRTWMDWRTEDFGKPTYLERLGLTLAIGEDGQSTRRIHALDADERTIGEALQEAGYTTAIVGKWHLGEWLKEHLPMQQGFDHQYGHYAWGIDYYDKMIPHNAPATFVVYDWHRDEKPIREPGYATDLIAEEAARFIADQSSDKPFFLYVPFNAVHGPINKVPRYTDKYSAPDAALKCFDDGVGKILATLDKHGFAENTLLVFTNDNGGLTEESNKPYRGTKNTTFEGGVRVPCVIRWPGHTKPGTKNHSMMHIVDCFPTLVTIAGGSLKQERPLDGVNCAAALFEGEASPRTEIIFEVKGSVRIPTIRSGDYKLMGDKLYNIVEDPIESKDVAADHPDLVKKLTARLADIKRPPLGDKPLLMKPRLPYVYGLDENKSPPEWLIEAVDAVRATQPKSWPPGETPWPQAPPLP